MSFFAVMADVITGQLLESNTLSFKPNLKEHQGLAPSSQT